MEKSSNRDRPAPQNEADAILRLLESAVHHANDAILITNADLENPGPTIVFANPAFSRMTGYRAEEILGKSPRFLQGPRTNRRLLDNLREKLGRGESFHGETINYRKDGTEFSADWRIAPIRDSVGKITHYVAIQRDITEQRKMLEALRQSEQLYRTLADSCSVGIWHTTPDGYTIYVNPAMLRLLELDTPAQLTGKTYHSFFTPESVETIEREHGKRARNQHSNYEVVMKGQGGAVRHLLVSGAPLFTDAGQVRSYIGTFVDFTEGRRVQEALRRNEQLYRAVVEDQTEFVVRWNPDGTRTFVNESYCRHYGRSREDLIGSSFYSEVDKEDWNRIQLKVLSMTRARPVVSDEHVNILPNGERRWHQWTDRAIFDSEGKLVEIQSVGHDVTERKRAEEELRESRELFQIVASATSDAIWDLDLITNHIWWSEGMHTLFGHDIHKTGSDLEWWINQLHPADRDRITRDINEVIRSQEETNWKGEYRFRRADGSYAWVSDHGYLIRDDLGRPVRMVGGMKDNTERKQAEEEKFLMERKLQETQKLESLGVLAGGIAHDFNNLLTGILGNASLARMELSASSPMHGFLEQIEAAAVRAADLCKQMLAYAGKGRFHIQRLDLNALVQDTTDLLQLSISKKAVLKFQFVPHLPVVLGDATQLRQILMNLVINASDAIGDKSGVISIATGVMRADRDYLTEMYLSPNLPEGDYVYLEVCDNGCGMSAEVKSKIFDPFFTTKFTGRGLGLAAVLGIVRGHKGALKVYSEEGRGSTFKLLLPCADGPAEEFRGNLAPSAAWRGHGTIMVVDDEETVRTVTARMLESFGFDVLMASDGRDAMAKFKENAGSIRFVILDLTMPHMDGEETFRELRRLNPHVRVLLMSGFNEQEAINRFNGKGLAGFIQKPFQPDSLREKIKEVFFSESDTHGGPAAPKRSPKRTSLD